MFSDRIFQDWSIVVLMAIGFALLFEVVFVLMDLLIDGRIRLSWSTVGFGLAAFVGFLCAAAVVRRLGK